MERLLYVITSLKTGGAERAMVRICEALKLDFDIRVAGLTGEDATITKPLDAAGIPYTNLRFGKGPSDVGGVARLNAMIRGFEPDILVCSLYHAAAVGSILGKLGGVKRIVSWEHSGHMGGPGRRGIKRMVDKIAWKVFCDSQRVYDEYQKLTGSRKAVLTPIGGLDVNRFRPDPAAHDGVVAVSVGRLEPIKGYDRLVQSAAQLDRSVGLRFRIAAEGPERARLEAMIGERSLGDRVSLEGVVEDVAGFLNEGDVYLQPSRNEGQCLAVIEAMACGLPVLAANVGGIPEAVEDGVNGYLVDPADTAAWNTRLERLAGDRELRRTMGKASRRIAVERYDIRNTIDVIRRELRDDG